MKQTLTTPLKIHGGKHYLASKIVELFPPRDTYLTYVEPYLGGGSVLLRHDPHGKSEIVGDVNLSLTGFWRTLQDPEKCDRLRARLAVTPFSEIEFQSVARYLERERMDKHIGDEVDAAWAFFVLARQSMSGRGTNFAPASVTRLRREMNEQASAWWASIDGLKQIADRLACVVIHEGPALSLIRKYDKPGVVMYLDPPYLAVDSDGRKVRESPDVYDHEMTTEQHIELLDALNDVEFASVLISGYPSKLYESKLTGWYKKVFAIDNKASKKAVKDTKEETVWANYELPT